MTPPVGTLARNLRVQQFIFILLVIGAFFSFLGSNPAPNISPIEAGCALAALLVACYAIFMHQRTLVARIRTDSLKLEQVKATTKTGDVIAHHLLSLQEAVKSQRAPYADKVSQDLEGLIASVQGAAARDSPLLTNLLGREITRWCEQASRWSTGQFSVGENNYLEILCYIYESASSEIFSTSEPEFLDIWESPAGARILDAHTSNRRVKVERIFVFDDRSEITPAHVKEMQRQSELKRVSVRVFIDRDIPGFSLPPGHDRDFTLIDNGSMLGVTHTIVGKGIEATWYVHGSPEVERFKLYKDSLSEFAITLPQLLAKLPG